MPRLLTIARALQAATATRTTYGQVLKTARLLLLHIWLPAHSILPGGCSGRWCTYTYALGVRCVLDLGSNNTNILCRLCVVLDNFTIVTGTFSFGKNTSSFVTAILISAPCSADGLEATARAPLPVHMMLTTATRSTYGLRYQAVTLILRDS